MLSEMLLTTSSDLIHLEDNLGKRHVSDLDQVTRFSAASLRFLEKRASHAKPEGVGKLFQKGVGQSC